MADRPTYTAPPVLEAIIHLSYVEPSSDGITDKLVQKLKRSYANATPIESVNANIDFANRKADFAGSQHYRLTSADETDVVVVQPSALTWSRLAPYEGWDSFFERVRAETEVAWDVTGYRKLARIGVRYINRLDVPLRDGLARYEDYLAVQLTIPNCWPAIDNYAWRFERRFGDLYAIVQSAIVEPEIPNTAAFLLDIDTIWDRELPAKLQDVRAAIESLRILKNEIFEVCITDTARASFAR